MKDRLRSLPSEIDAVIYTEMDAGAPWRRKTEDVERSEHNSDGISQPETISFH